MAITYQAGRRLQGLTTDFNPTYSDDFSSDGWTDNDSTNMGVSGGTFNWNAKRDGTNDASVYDLTSTSANWVLRFKLHVTNVSSSTQAGNGFFVGLSDSNQTADQSTSQDFIGMSIYNDNTDTYQTIDADGATVPRLWAGDNSQTTTYSTGSIYYYQIIKTGSSYTVEGFTGSDYSTGSTGSISGTSSASGLRYLKILNENDNIGTSTNPFQGTIDDLEFYDGATVANSGKPTNVQVGSRLEETDTRKMYHYESATPTFEDDFSISSGWVVSGSQFTVDTSTDERLEYALKRTGNTNDYVYKDLQDSDALGSGINASDTEWVLRYHMVHTSDTGNNSKNTPAIMGLSSTNNGYLDTQDYIGVRLETGETPQYSASSGDGGSANTMTDFSQFQTAYPLTGTDDFYVEIKRISSTEFTVEFFSDSGYTISVEKETVTTLNSTVDNLRYLVIKVGYGTADDDTLNGYIDDIKFYNGVTTAGTAWTEEGT